MKRVNGVAGTQRVIPPPKTGWIVFSFVLYVVLGTILKSVVLNWVVGPLFLFTTLWAVPSAIHFLRSRQFR